VWRGYSDKVDRLDFCKELSVLENAVKVIKKNIEMLCIDKFPLP